MAKREYVEKVMKTWTPHVLDDEVESIYRHMQADFQERVKSSLEYKLTEYAEALGHPPGPWVAHFEGAAIEIEVLKSVTDFYLGEYLEEIEKRSRGFNRDYYAHLWTIQDPDGWKKNSLGDRYESRPLPCNQGDLPRGAGGFLHLYGRPARA